MCLSNDKNIRENSMRKRQNNGGSGCPHYPLTYNILPDKRRTNIIHRAIVTTDRRFPHSTHQLSTIGLFVNEGKTYYYKNKLVKNKYGYKVKKKYYRIDKKVLLTLSTARGLAGGNAR